MYERTAGAVGEFNPAFGADAQGFPGAIPPQRGQPLFSVRRSPRLWSILYDGLSVRDQRWVLETIARHGDRGNGGTS